MRILHLMPPYGFGGVHSFLFNYYKYMDRQKFQFDLLTRGKNFTLPDEYADCRYGIAEMLAKGCPEEEKRKRISEILGSGYDVLHLHTSSWSGRGFYLEEAAQEAGIPRVIVHSHNSYIADLNLDEETRQTLFRRHQELKKQFSKELATDFWACSRIAADWLFGSQIPREQIQIIKNAIDVERYRFRSEIRKCMRDIWEIGDSFLLGTVGGFTFQKNPGFLIEILYELRKKHKNIKLMMVGTGELRADLEKQIQEKNLAEYVIMPGWVADVENYLWAMDGFLFPSRFEGFGIAPLEALAAGLPCAISEAVPEELMFTDLICRLPLELSAWVSAADNMIRIGKDVNRQDGADIVRTAGYDVKLQAKVLEKLYCIS